MKKSTKRDFLLELLAVVGLCSTHSVWAQQATKIAVTDLAYTSAVAQYFEAGTYSEKASLNANRHSVSASYSGSGTYVAGTHTYMEQRELRSFTNDIKGQLIQGTTFRLVQGKGFDAGEPQPTKAEQALQQIQTGKVSKSVRQPEVRDVIARIKKGEFSGADYVLFGQLSSIEFRDQLTPIQGTSSTSHQFLLDLLADFSLINTKTLEIKAAFSAQGNGNDTKLLSSRGDIVPPNRAKVMRETSQSLSRNVYEQLAAQLGMDAPMSQRLRTGQPVVGTPAGQPQQAPADQVQILR